MPSGLSQAATEEPECELPPIPNPVLDAPEFPEFELSEIEAAEGEAVDIAALELEALDFLGSDLPLPVDFDVPDFEASQPDLFGCDPTEPSVSSVAQDLNIGSKNIILLDPASFPEPINFSDFPEPAAPGQWSQSEEAIADPLSHSLTDETDLGAAECHSVPEETELSNHAEMNDGIQPHPRWVKL